MKHLYFLFFLLFANTPLLPAQVSTLAKGVIIDTLVCKSNKAHKYALYLPSYYHPLKKYPLIYVFDPSSEVKTPMGLLKESAEKYGYILVGGYQYKNGPVDFSIVDILSQEISEEFLIDESRIYMAGFSGSSRYSASVAMLSNKIRGVIACGAGFNGKTPSKPTHDFDYVAIVGTEDMNYRELSNNYTRLTLGNFSNVLLLFSGGHDWPSAILMGKAVEWLEVQAMHRGLKKVDTVFLNNYHYQKLFLVDSLIENKQYIQADQVLQDLKKDYQAFQSDEAQSKLLTKITKLKATDYFQTALQEEEKIKKTENELIEKYLEAIRSDEILSIFPDTTTLFNISWWQKEYEKLLAMGNSETEKILVVRMLDFVRRNNMEPARFNIDQGKYKLALKKFQISEVFWPGTVAPPYYIAKSYALLGNKTKSIDYLKKSVENGLKYKKYIAKEPAFGILKGNKKFEELLGGLE